MRQIKFRAFLPERNKMVSADELAFDFCEPLVDQLRDNDLMKFMQFTGLKDANGVEVYEGDVVKYLTHTAHIFWSPQDFGFVHYNEVIGGYAGLSFFTGYKDFEVIGNIHENPELLEG